MAKLALIGAAALTLLTTETLAQASATTGPASNPANAERVASARAPARDGDCFSDMAALRAAGIQTSYRQTNSSDSDPLNINITGGNGGRFLILVTKFGDPFVRGTARICRENGRVELRAVNGRFTAGPAVDRIGAFAPVVRSQINGTAQINLTPNGDRLQANLGGPLVFAPARVAR